MTQRDYLLKLAQLLESQAAIHDDRAELEFSSATLAITDADFSNAQEHLRAGHQFRSYADGMRGSAAIVKDDLARCERVRREAA